MNKYISWLWCLLGLIGSAWVQASMPSSVAIRDWVQLKQQTHPGWHMGFVVYNLATRQMVYADHASAWFVPASVQKTLTATAAMLSLGAHYRFKTTALKRGYLKTGVWHGDIYLRFSGDPSFDSQQLHALLHAIFHQGIKKITGRIVIDDSVLGHVPYGPGWMWDELSYGFAAPLPGVIVNRNRFALWVRPAKQLGAVPLLKLDSPSGVLKIINHAKTTKKYARHCPLLIYSNDRNQYRLSGCVAQQVGRLKRVLAVRDVMAYLNDFIQQDCRAAGVVCPAQLMRGRVAHGATVVKVVESKPLSELLKKMLHDSDNMYADALFKVLGHVDSHAVGTWLTGSQALKNILAAQLQVDLSAAELVDGAGLSRYNLLRPMDLLALLQGVYAKPVWRKQMLSWLPISGRSGTLIDRLRDWWVRDRVYAKTGSMSGVSSLVGYVLPKQGDPLAFVMMTNGFVGRVSAVHQVEDAFLHFLLGRDR